MSTMMIVAGSTAIFAVCLLFLAMMVSRGSAAGVANAGVFKTGNPNLRGGAATLGVREGSVEIPATLEAARSGVRPRPSEDGASMIRS